MIERCGFGKQLGHESTLTHRIGALVKEVITCSFTM
jgi:hypothetical protein